jgi:hypothetical protein
MYHRYLIALILTLFSITSVASEEWPSRKGCGFSLGGCRKSIEVGESFTACMGWAFVNVTDANNWKKEQFRERLKPIPVGEAKGSVKIRPDVVMTAKTPMISCCPAGWFQGVANHPELGEIYLVNEPGLRCPKLN